VRYFLSKVPTISVLRDKGKSGLVCVTLNVSDDVDMVALTEAVDLILRLLFILWGHGSDDLRNGLFVGGLRYYFNDF